MFVFSLFFLFFHYSCPSSPSICSFYAFFFFFLQKLMRSRLIHRGPGGEAKQVLDVTANPLIHPPLINPWASVGHASIILSLSTCHFVLYMYVVCSERQIHLQICICFRSTIQRGLWGTQHVCHGACSDGSAGAHVRNIDKC